MKIHLLFIATLLFLALLAAFMPASAMTNSSVADLCGSYRLNEATDQSCPREIKIEPTKLRYSLEKVGNGQSLSFFGTTKSGSQFLIERFNNIDGEVTRGERERFDIHSKGYRVVRSEEITGSLILKSWKVRCTGIIFQTCEDVSQENAIHLIRKSGSILSISALRSNCVYIKH